MAWNFVRLWQDRSSFKYGEELSRRGPSKTHRSRRGGFGPRRLGPGCDGIDRSAIDAAILDVHLGDEFAFPVADRFYELAIPFILTTGHDRAFIPAEYTGFALCEMPTQLAKIACALWEDDIRSR